MQQSGVKGITWHGRKGQWQTSKIIAGINYTSGYFKDLSEAIEYHTMFCEMLDVEHAADRLEGMAKGEVQHYIHYMISDKNPFGETQRIIDDLEIHVKHYPTDIPNSELLNKLRYDLLKRRQIFAQDFREYKGNVNSSRSEYGREKLRRRRAVQANVSDVPGEGLGRGSRENGTEPFSPFSRFGSVEKDLGVTYGDIVMVETDHSDGNGCELTRPMSDRRAEDSPLRGLTMEVSEGAVTIDGAVVRPERGGPTVAALETHVPVEMFEDDMIRASPLYKAELGRDGQEHTDDELLEAWREEQRAKGKAIIDGIIVDGDTKWE